MHKKVVKRIQPGSDPRRGGTERAGSLDTKACAAHVEAIIEFVPVASGKKDFGEVYAPRRARVRDGAIRGWLPDPSGLRGDTVKPDWSSDLQGDTRSEDRIPR